MHFQLCHCPSKQANFVEGLVLYIYREGQIMSELVEKKNRTDYRFNKPSPPCPEGVGRSGNGSPLSFPI